MEQTDTIMKRIFEPYGSRRLTERDVDKISEEVINAAKEHYSSDKIASIDILLEAQERIMFLNGNKKSPTIEAKLNFIANLKMKKNQKGQMPQYKAIVY